MERREWPQISSHTRADGRSRCVRLEPDSGTALPIAPIALSPERHENDLRALASEHFDVLVVGGGIVGAGIALDAASRGLKVAIVEAQDWASGSSSRSSKLVHGGLRYLEQREFALVREALHERSTLMRTAPHLVRPVRFVLPLRQGVIERAYVAAGLVIYDLLARISRTGPQLPFHRQLSLGRAKALVPALDSRVFTGAIQYWDAQVDDARHSLSVLRTAASYGAVVANRCAVTDLIRTQGRVTGAQVKSMDTGETYKVNATAVISAVGVWTEEFESLAGTPDGLHISPSKGVHLVVPRNAVESSAALIFRTDRSVLFILPWGNHWIIGTTDSKWTQDVSFPAATASDIAYILGAANAVLARPLTSNDIESVFVGLRPLIASSRAETTNMSREHAVAHPSPGLVVVSGGKYTTYRVIAKNAVDATLAHAGLYAPASRTATIPLVGGDRFTEVFDSRDQLATSSGLDKSEIDRLLGRYGSLLPELLAEAESDASLLRPLAEGTGYLRAEVNYAVTHEGARHLDDVLIRRTRLSIESSDRGRCAAEEAGSIMAKHLGWNQSVLTKEITRYHALIESQMAGEHEVGDAEAAVRLRESVPGLPYP